MNRAKRARTKSVTKAMNKEIRKGQQINPLNALEPAPAAVSYKQMLSKYPKKIAAKDKSLILSMTKEMEIKKQKKHKVSKRTTPGTMPSDSTPRSPHIEGKRWIKTIIKQNVSQGRTLTKRLSKKR